MRLLQRDLLKVLGAVGILTADSDPVTLPTRTNDAVKFLVSTDVLSFEAFGTDNDYQGSLWYTPEGTVSNDLLQVMADHVHEQPFYTDLVTKKSLDAVRIGDYLPLAKYKKTSIYNEFFRNIDTDRQMVATLAVDPTLTVSVSLCRLGKEFTDRDCNVVEMLKPHLVSAFHVAQFINRSQLESGHLQAALEATKYGAVPLDQQLRVQVESPFAVRLFGKYFGSETGSVPDELKRYLKFHLPKLRGDEFYLPPEPVSITGPNGKLVIRLSYDSTTNSTVLLLEEISDPHPFDRLIARLTQREATVLFWISQGKTDGQIAVLLEISSRTVQKHVEHIFDKLGVETRSAATARFLQGSR